MKQCFGFTLEQYIYFGDYPVAATLVDEHERWVVLFRDIAVFAYPFLKVEYEWLKG